jgi:hypothetical protein
MSPQREGLADSAPVQTLAPTEYSTPAHAGAAAEIVQDDENAYCVVKGTVSDAPFVLSLGWVDVNPETLYRASYPVQGPGADGRAALYLMVREHSARGVRPFPNYHKTSVRTRALAPTPAGQWTERRLDFATGPETHTLSVALVISSLNGELRIGSLTLSDIRARLTAEYRDTMREVRAAAAARKRIVPRTLVFSRSQMKYGLERNYEHVWTDRPLFVNRAYRDPAHVLISPEGYERILHEVVQYGIDGLAFFPETRNRMTMFEMTDAAAVPGIRLLPEFLPTQNLEAKSALLEAALACESTVRIDGKVLITSYVSQSLTPAQWAEILAQLRRRHGDSFIFLPALTHTVGLRGDFSRGDPIARERIEDAQAFLRQYLDVCDGIYFNYPAAFKNPDRTFDEAFYSDLFIPVFKSVLSEPAYRDKYLGLSAYHSHSNPDLSIGLLEDGTRTLRHSFEAAMAAEPDVIVLPEWDEVNENTCFRPTVCNSTTSQRIIRSYMATLKGQPPTPLPDDDTTVPNLIISMRNIATLGETLVIELLNVPDGSRAGTYSATLALIDEDGRPLRKLDPVTFNIDTLQEKRYELPTEDFPQAQAIIPTLSIEGYHGRNLTVDHGLPHTQIRATWNWDYKFVKQPLRELVSIRTANITWAADVPMPQGALALTGQVDADEDLALVEVIADGDVAYAVNTSDEPLTADVDRETIRIEYRAARTQDVAGTVELRGAKARWMLNLPHLHQKTLDQREEGGTLHLEGQVSSHVRWSCLSIPRAQLDAASLDIRLADVHLSLPVRDILEKGMVGAAGDTGIHVTAYPYRRQLDMPYHLKAKEAAFTIPFWPWMVTEQVHLRLTAVSGRTYRTRPLLLPGRQKGETVPLRIRSDTFGKPLDVQVQPERIPDIRYDFDPSRGAVLLTDAGHDFWASLGGFPDTTSGRGGRPSASMFTYNATNGYPANAQRTAPTWVTDNGEPALEFDGKGTFVHLPRESLPRRGAFTLSFDIKPTAVKDAVLFVHRAHRPQGLTLSIRDGALHASYFAEGHVMYQVETQIAVPVGVWSTVRVVRDFENLVVALGAQSEQEAVTLPAFDMGPIVFGGFGETSAQSDPETGNPGWFKGRMKNLHIRHNSL